MRKEIGMNMLKILSHVFAVFAIIVSNMMCAIVAYKYCDMQHGIHSAPAYVAFIYAVPYLFSIIVCVIISLVLGKKAKRIYN